MPTEPSEPPRPPVPSGPARGWGTIGFALLVTGAAGLLFHLNTGVGILRSHLGQISLGLIAVGMVLLVVGIFRQSMRR